MKTYIINFFIWWYLYKVKDLFLYVRFRFVYILTLTRTWPMISNFTRPLYGDTSPAGRLMGFFIRFWWIIFGAVISIIYIIPFVVGLIISFVLPFIPVYQILLFAS